MAEFKPIDLDRFHENARLTEARVFPRAVAISFNEKRRRVHIEMDNGLEWSFPIADVFEIANLSDDDLNGVEIEGAGNAIRFPDSDTDLSMPNLLERYLGGLDWARREARANASRENGKKGGRPRKRPAEIN